MQRGICIEDSVYHSIVEVEPAVQIKVPCSKAQAKTMYSKPI